MIKSNMVLFLWNIAWRQNCKSMFLDPACHQHLPSQLLQSPWYPIMHSHTKPVSVTTQV